MTKLYRPWHILLAASAAAIISWITEPTRKPVTFPSIGYYQPVGVF